MKISNWLGLICLLLPLALNAQDPEIGKVYESNGVYELSPNNVPGEIVQFLKGTKVYVVELERNATGEILSVTFKGLPWKESLEAPSQTIVTDKKKGTEIANAKYADELKKYNNNKAIVEKLFKLSLSDFLLKFKEIKDTDLKSRLNIGVLYQPIKLRVSREFSYETNVNFSASLAWTLCPNSSTWDFFSVVVAPGVTNVTLNPQNSKFFEQSQDIDEVNVPAFAV